MAMIRGKLNENTDHDFNLLVKKSNSKEVSDSPNCIAQGDEDKLIMSVECL